MRLRSSIAGTPRQRKFWLSATKFADGLRSCGASGWNRNRYLWASCWLLVVGRSLLVVGFRSPAPTKRRTLFSAGSQVDSAGPRRSRRGWLETLGITGGRTRDRLERPPPFHLSASWAASLKISTNILRVSFPVCVF